jgi:hypothetical protein
MSRLFGRGLRLIGFVVVWQVALANTTYAAGELNALPTSEPSALSPSFVVAWRSLHYKGKHWLGRMTAELKIQHSRELDDAIPTATHPVKPNDWIAELHTRFESLFLANRSTRLRASFDRSTGAVSDFTRLSLGRRPDFKQYDFRPDGVERLRVEPARGETSLPNDQWSASHRSFYSLTLDRLGCRVISDPGAMAFWLSASSGALRESPEDSRFCYFAGKTLYLVRFEFLGSADAEVDYQRVEGGVRSHRSGRLKMERYGVVARPIAGKLDESAIRAEILIEADTRIPWRFLVIEGPMKVNVVLDEVVLGEPEWAPPSGAR